ncbi:DUF1236 domain-containing protein [Rhizobium sp. NXC24]|uniref:DUF1236 domain-containing protein n=1 Tax=Rhizobium sp. NXC24 TaxID=2048897 RepID=UPI000CDF415E|nr:DUF1236 domain-containing protein [Rhizobium sp. NXC24]AVA25621.1 hypothetical protein NXC24_PC01180 [Rhizobium sp. NXC24]
MKRILIAVSAALFASGTAFAQSTTVVVPGEVRTYVTEQEVPSVTYDGDIVVGSELPSSVEVHTIPSNSDYAYTVVNKKRVIVSQKTHKIVEVVK